MIKKTSFNGGGLVRENILAVGRHLDVPENFTVPIYIDSRPYMLPTDDQGETSECAGYAMAAWIEVITWWNTNIAKQVDASLLYARAKEIDGCSYEGTTFEAIIASAKSLEMIGQDQEAHYLGNAEDVRFAMHKHRICMAGFAIDSNWNNVDDVTGYIGREQSATRMGGHAVTICWYDKYSIGFQNSWGIVWGKRGFGRMTWEQFDKQFMYGVVLEN